MIRRQPSATRVKRLTTYGHSPEVKRSWCNAGQLADLEEKFGNIKDVLALRRQAIEALASVWDEAPIKSAWGRGHHFEMAAFFTPVMACDTSRAFTYFAPHTTHGRALANCDARPDPLRRCAPDGRS